MGGFPPGQCICLLLSGGDEGSECAWGGLGDGGGGGLPHCLLLLLLLLRLVGDQSAGGARLPCCSTAGAGGVGKLGGCMSAVDPGVGEVPCCLYYCTGTTSGLLKVR